MFNLSDNIYISDNIGIEIKYRIKKDQEPITNTNMFARYASTSDNKNLCVEFDKTFSKIPINSIFGNVITKFSNIPNVLELDVCNDKQDEETATSLQIVQITNSGIYNSASPNLDLVEKPTELTVKEFLTKNNDKLSKLENKTSQKYFPIEKKDLTKQYIISLAPSNFIVPKTKLLSTIALNQDEATKLFLIKNNISTEDYNNEINDYLNNKGNINRTNFKYIVFYNLLNYIFTRQPVDSGDINELNDITNQIVSNYFPNDEGIDDNLDVVSV
ncbi:unknown [Gryllus bimaculatus nudivirus]|uniref:Uncharacterized protein n=1 Tax=Gryllus bimaculatus nudivirus TaxID=432587 RepID=A4L242_9VIRU|nr:hypothetical protein GrBNV_gp79 [Gryllus bimaculatus nudivirus]ABO45412.1 unknown [Gryllus bimaculatus nudivirus]